MERLIRAGALDSLGEPRRELLWQLREVAGARGRRTVDRCGSKKAQGRPLDLRLPPTLAPDLPPPDRARAARRRLRDPVARRRRQVIELFRRRWTGWACRTAGLDSPAGQGGIGGLVVTRQHPMTARGTVFLALEDETGMVNVTLWPDTWARLRGVVRRHALLYIEGRLERESNVVNLIAHGSSRSQRLPTRRRSGAPGACATWVTPGCAARARRAAGLPAVPYLGVEVGVAPAA